jgi:hypothetical protein
MASTRNKNTSTNYNIEQSQYKKSENYELYKNSQYGEAYSTKLSGDGFNPGQIPVNKLSHNYSDIESFLFGINSTNLVNPAQNLTPQLINLDSEHLYKKSTIFIPEPLVIEKSQRPLRM